MKKRTKQERGNSKGSTGTVTNRINDSVQTIISIAIFAYVMMTILVLVAVAIIPVSIMLAITGLKQRVRPEGIARATFTSNADPATRNYQGISPSTGKALSKKLASNRSKKSKTTTVSFGELSKTTSKSNPSTKLSARLLKERFHDEPGDISWFQMKLELGTAKQMYNADTAIQKHLKAEKNVQ